jgi:hypothetical protein
MSTTRQRKTLTLSDDSIAELRLRNKDNHSEAARAIIRRYAFIVREGQTSLRANFSEEELNAMAVKFRHCQFDYPESILFLDSIATLQLTPKEQRWLADMTLAERIAFIDAVEINRRNAGQA